MKKFENPAIEVIEVNVEDVIATSGGNGGDENFGGAANIEW